MDIARYVRIFELEPDDDFVMKRKAALKDLRNRFAKQSTIAEAMALGNALAGALSAEEILPEKIASQVEAAIKKQSVSFVRTGRQLEMNVCSLLAGTQLVTSAG